MIRFYIAPWVQLDFPNGWRPMGSKTMLYRVNYSRHTVISRDDTSCVVRVDADELEHAAIAADTDIVETNGLDS
jgi:hypothetical protein